MASRILQAFRSLRDWQGLTGERGFLRLKVHTLYDSAVGSDEITGLEQEKVARDVFS